MPDVAEGEDSILEVEVSTPQTTNSTTRKRKASPNSFQEEMRKANNKGAGRGGGRKDPKGNRKTYAGNNKAFLTRGSICMQFNGSASGCTQVNCQRKHVCMAEDAQGVICGGNHSILEHGE